MTVQDAEYHTSHEVKDIYPDFVKMAASFSVPAKRVLRPEELRPAIRYKSAALHRKTASTNYVLFAVHAVVWMPYFQSLFRAGMADAVQQTCML